MERVKKALAENGKSHIYIDEKTLSTKDASMSAYLMDHFRSFHPDQVSLCGAIGIEAPADLIEDPEIPERVVHPL